MADQHAVDQHIERTSNDNRASQSATTACREREGAAAPAHTG